MYIGMHILCPFHHHLQSIQMEILFKDNQEFEDVTNLLVIKQEDLEQENSESHTGETCKF